jgi:hypothetical protein
MAQEQWVNVKIRVQAVLPDTMNKYILEKMEELAVHPEKFFELKTSEKILVLYNLARAPLKDLLVKYSAFIELIAQRDSLLFIMLLRMMNKKKRQELARRRYALVKMVAEELSTR